MTDQQCLVIIKPDGLIKSITGNIISHLSETKLKIVGAKIVRVSRELAELHYDKLKEEKIKEHGEKEGMAIYESVLKYIQGEFHTDRVFVLVYQGPDAIKKIREVAGDKNPEKAEPTSIRGKYGRIHSKTKVYENVMHASSSEEAAKKEIQLWFQPDELTEIIYPTKLERITSNRKVWNN